MSLDVQIPRLLMTMMGPIEPKDAGITDAHNHLWITPVPGSASDSPVLDDQMLIGVELSVDETRGSSEPVRAGLIKIACEETAEKSPTALREAAAIVSREKEVSIQIHTEKGADSEQIVQTITQLGTDPERLVLCHMDKHPDFEYHRQVSRREYRILSQASTPTACTNVTRRLTIDG